VDRTERATQTAWTTETSNPDYSAAVSQVSRTVVTALAAMALGGAACGDDDDTSSTTASGSDVSGGITVFAATSLTESFTEIGEAFTAANPDADAEFSFDASSALVQQIIEGAPADVYASADTANMDKLTEADLEGSEPEIFATNLLAIMVEPGNPLGITGVEDLADPAVKVAICAEEVPCGTYARQVFDAAGVDVTPVTQEQNVRGVATKVTAGEVDAGIVYVTDVIAAGDAAEIVEIPDDINVVARYPAATVAESAQPDVAAAFVDFLLGAEAQAILGEHGFGGQ
jgi:molybdate transport system substrate-binding protein